MSTKFFRPLLSDFSGSAPEFSSRVAAAAVCGKAVQKLFCRCHKDITNCPQLSGEYNFNRSRGRLSYEKGRGGYKLQTLAFFRAFGTERSHFVAVKVSLRL